MAATCKRICKQSDINICFYFAKYKYDMEGRVEYEYTLIHYYSFYIFLYLHKFLSFVLIGQKQDLKKIIILTKFYALWAE